MAEFGSGYTEQTEQIGSPISSGDVVFSNDEMGQPIGGNTMQPSEALSELIVNAPITTIDADGDPTSQPYKPSVHVQDAPTSQTAVPDYLMVLGAGDKRIYAENEEALSLVSIDNLKLGTFAIASKRLYYLADKSKAGAGMGMDYRWVRIPLGEDISSISISDTLIKMVEATDDYNRKKWAELKLSIDGFMVTVGDNTSYLDGRYSNLHTLFEMTASQIRLEAENTQRYLNGRITENEAQILLNAQQILLKVTQSDLDPLRTRITTAESSIQLQASEIALRVKTVDHDILKSRMTTAESAIIQHASDILLKASQVEVDGLRHRISSAELLIDGANAAILLKASQESVDALSSRVSTAEININGAKADILLKASQESVDQLGSRVTAAEIDIDGANAAILLKASKESVDALTTRVSSAEVAIDGANAAILLKASQESVNTLSGTVGGLVSRVSAAEVAIDGTNAAILLKASQESVTALSNTVGGISTRLSAAEVAIDGVNAAILLKASQTEVTAIGNNLSLLTTRVSNAEVAIDGANAAINLKASQESVNSLDTRMNSAEIAIDGANSSISLVATTANNASTRIAAITLDAAQGVSVVAEKVVFSNGQTITDKISSSSYNDASLKDQLARNIGYADYNDFYNSSITSGKVIISNGMIAADMLDVEGLFAKSIIARNMSVLSGKVGDFAIDGKLIGTGSTGNQVLIDPQNNEIVMAKNGVKRVRLTNEELTALALLKVDGGTIYCSSGTSVSSGVQTFAVIASKDALTSGPMSMVTYLGVGSGVPQLTTASATVPKVSLPQGQYSLDIPLQLNVVHNGGKADNNTYFRLTGSNTATLTVTLKSQTLGTVKSSTENITINVDTQKTGASVAIPRTVRFNFSNNSTDQFWIELSLTIANGTSYPIRYQSWNSGNAFRSGWWSEQTGYNVQYEMSVRPGLSFDGSIGITELSNSGFQSVWTNHRYIRVDGNTSNPVFIESEGVWMHNGVEVKFDKNTITGYIDPTVYATRNYVDTGFVRSNGGTVAGDLTITGNLYLQQDGKYIVTEKVYSENDFITLRYNNPSLLAQGAYTGFEAKKVFSDGSDGYLVYGNDGMARVGKLSSLQTLATREDSPLDDGMAVWSTASKRFNSIAKGAITVGNADKLGGIAASSYIMYSPNKNTHYNHFAIGQVDGRNFIQSHNSQPLDLNPLGNLVYINGNESIHDGNILSKTAGFAQRLPSVTSNYYNDNCLQYWNAASGDLLPTQSWWYNIRMAHGNADTYYSSHLAFDFFSDTIKYQRREGGTLKGWVNLWHSGNANRNTIDWTARDLYADAIYSSFIRSDNNVCVISRAGAAQNVLMGGLLVSNAYADVDKLPTNGIWSKGTIVSYSTLQASSRWGALVIGDYDKSWNNSAYPTIRSTHPDGLFMLMNPHIPWRTVALGNVASSGSEGSFIRSEMPSGYWDAGVNKNVSDSYYAFNSNGVNRFSITTNGNVIMAGSALKMYGSGSGNYNQTLFYAMTTGAGIEAPLEADDPSANRLPITFSWRGGYATKGGMSLTTGGVRLRNLDLISDDANGSGFTASGWRIGNYSNLLNVDVRGKLQVYEFVQNKISILNGNMLVSDNAKCSNISRVTDANGKHINITFPEQCPFKVGDVIRCKTSGKDYQLTVDWVSSDLYSIACWSEAAVYDANVTAVGDFFIRWNSSDVNRKGLLYLNSSDTNNPNFQVLYDGAVKAQLGNVAGLMWMGSALPANTYGVWVANGYFDGAINANSGKIAGWSMNSYELTGSDGTYSIGIGKSYGIHNWRNSDAGYNWKLNTDGSGMLARGAITWDTAGNFSANSGKIANWVIDSVYLKSASDRIVMRSDISSIWVTKPAGGHVMLGQTFINGNWTGKYGFSATNPSNQELVRFDDEINRIAGWTITPYELNNYNGSGNGVVLHSSQGMGTITGWGSTWTNQLRIDGSGMLARGNISWDSVGYVTFADSVKVQWENYSDNNLCRYKDRWRIGGNASQPFGIGYGWQNGTTNTFINGTLPSGSMGVVMRMQGTNSGGGNGGWDWYFPNIDTSYTYRYSLWVYRDSTSGTIYHGCEGARILTINGNTNDNPYMYYSSFAGRLSGWYLIVGYVHHYGYSSSNTNPRADAGVYNVKGEKVENAVSDYKWKDANTIITTIFRSYLYYGGDNAYSYFYAPALHKCDGSEPTIRQMVDSATGRNRTTQIDANGIYTGTLTAQQVLATNAVFSSANIADASITSAKIASLDVSKLTGDIISGKIFINRNASNIRQLEIGNGNIYTYTSTGAIASQMNLGELKFFDTLGVPSLFLKNSAVTLAGVSSGNSFTVGAVGNINSGSSAVSNSFSIDSNGLGSYYATSTNVTCLVSASYTYVADNSSYVVTDYQCYASTLVQVTLEKYNGSGWDNMGVIGSSSIDSNSDTSLSTGISGTRNVNLTYTINESGTYRYRFNVYTTSWAQAYNPVYNWYWPTVLSSESGYFSFSNSFSVIRLNNGTYIGTNGLTSYYKNSGTGEEKYFSIDTSASEIVRIKGVMKVNECPTTDVLLQFYASGSAGYDLSVIRWTGHSTYTTKNDFSLVRIGGGQYRLTHNLYNRGVISLTTQYEVMGVAGRYYISRVDKQLNTVTIYIADDDSTNDASEIFLSVISMLNWKTT